MRKINTVRFGVIEEEDDKIVKFNNGIPAFEDEHEFLIVPYDASSPYLFLQSAASPDLAFLMTSPFVFFPDYELEINDEAIAELGIKTQEDILVYTLITIPGGNIKEMTTNLMAPVVINQTNMQAKQIILDGGRYHTRHRLFPAAKEAS